MTQFLNPKQIFESNKTINMTHFLKDQMKYRSDPSFLQLRIEKNKTKEYQLLFWNGETQNFRKK